MITLTIANHKGGTGKTATARALGDYIAGEGYMVLMVDLDPQASLTMSCNYKTPVSPSMVDVFGGPKPGDQSISAIIKPVGERLDLAPSSLDMAGVELGIAARLGREYILKRTLDQLQNYDLVIIDCPPSMGLIVINAIVAADAVLIPTQPTPVDITGVRRFIDMIETIRDGTNTRAEILGILPTFHDKRYNTHQATLDAMRAAEWPLMGVSIGRSVRVAEAAAVGQSVITYEPNNPQAENYKLLGKELTKWLKNKTK
jgi:chromosome partitioning protein